MLPPDSEKPPDERLEMLLLSHVPFVAFGSVALMPPNVSCSYARNVVEAPALITFGSVAGDPIVLVTPASPELTTTVTPAAIASSSAIRVASFAVSGSWFAPNDSFSTCTPFATA